MPGISDLSSFASQVVSHMEILDFAGSTEMLDGMESLASGIYDDAQTIVKGLHPAHCMKRRRLQLGMLLANRG